MDLFIGSDKATSNIRRKERNMTSVQLRVIIAAVVLPLLSYLASHILQEETLPSPWIKAELDRLLPESRSVMKRPLTAAGQHPNVSAILLNWSRFRNVLLITSSLCHNEDIAEVVVWNNNPAQNLTYRVSYSPER